MRRNISAEDYVTAAWSTNEHEAKAKAGKYCRDLYQAGYSPICPILFQGEFLDDSDTTEHKDKMDMAEELLRRSRVQIENMLGQLDVMLRLLKRMK